MNRKPNSLNALLSVLVGLTLILSAVQPINVSASASPAQGDGIRRGVHPQTGKLSFLGADPSNPLRVSAAMGRGLAPEARGSSILEMYGSEFGIQDAARELSVMKSSSVDNRLMVRYQQVYNDIPVMAGELIVNMMADGSLLSINGEASPNLKVDTQPKITAEAARQLALRSIATTYNLNAGDLTVSEPALWIFDERLVQENVTQPVHLVWRMEVTSANAPLRELVLVNAKTGKISLHFNQVDTAWTGNPVEQEFARLRDDGIEPVAESVPTVVSEPIAAPVEVVNMPLSAPNPADIDRFVAPTGVDSGTCNEKNNPCQKINYAISQAADGEIVGLAEGVYTDQSQQYVIVLVSKGLSFYGGWNSNYSSQVGFSIVDGENKVGGVNIYGFPQKTIILDHFIVRDGSNGGISHTNMNLIVTNSSIYNNHKIGGNANGGGIWNYVGNLTLSNVTISNNTASSGGGGISSSEGNIILNNVTITNNKAYEGGGIVVGTGTTRQISNSIIYGNQASYRGPDCYASFTSTDHTIVGDTTLCTIPATNGNQLNVNPQLGTFIEGVGYQPLLAGSPAIDAGLGCYDTVDQRGYARVGACDVGAYEYPSSIGVASRLVLAGGDHQRAAPLTVFESLLAVAVLDAQGSPVSGQSVTFTAPSTGASGTFPGGVTSAIVDTGPDGIVSLAFTANNQVGSYPVTAEFSGLTFSFNLQNITWFVKPGGDDLNDCATPLTPCATINGALSKMADGETIFVASGVYTGADSYVVTVNKLAYLVGGWNSTFTVRDSYSMIDGENTRQGIYTTGSGATMDGFIIQNGSSVAFGGGLLNDGTFTISNSIFQNNSAEINGGGVWNMGILTLNNVQIYENTSGSGGGIFHTGSSLAINNSAIFSNSSDYGGGIYSNGKVTVNNSTISWNVANQYGGGIYNEYGTFTLNNVTISNNHSDYGGGIYNYNSNVNSVLIKNTILANNTAGSSGPNCGEEMAFGSVKSSGTSIISNTSGCSYVSGVGDLINVDPVLGTFLPSRGYHPILTGSPAINAGSACYGSTDQRGVARVGACDIGAYEYVPFGSAAFMEIVGGDNQRTAPTFSFGAPFSVVILDDNGSPVSGQSVTFTAPASGPSGTFANHTNVDVPVTDLGGVATSSVFTANSETGSYTVSATSGIGVLNFNTANLALYVGPAGSDSNDCQSAITACVSIQGAVDKARKNDVIFVAEGIYSSAASQVVNLTKNLTLSGGWDSTFTTQTGYSTINGGGTSSGVIVPIGVTASMQRFVVTNSWNNAIQKGGVYNSGTLTLTQCEISSNTPSYPGGGIYNPGTLTLDDCVVKNNTSMTSGGGIYNSGQLTVVSSVITNNKAGQLSAGAQSYGGGIYNEGTANISNSLIIENTGFMGAGIYSLGSLVLSRVSVSTIPA
jgi:hypothetical protein